MTDRPIIFSAPMVRALRPAGGSVNTKPTYKYNHEEALAAADVVRILLQDFYRDQPQLQDLLYADPVHSFTSFSGFDATVTPVAVPLDYIWKGRRIRKMTRDQLIECVLEQAGYIQRLEAMPKDFRKMAADKIHEAKK